MSREKQKTKTRLGKEARRKASREYIIIIPHSIYHERNPPGLADAGKVRVKRLVLKARVKPRIDLRVHVCVHVCVVAAVLSLILVIILAL